MTKYDWDAWFDGAVWKLKRGEDYDDVLRNRSVQAAIESAAIRRGLQVVSRNVDNNTVRLRVTGKLEQKTVPEGYTGLRCRVCGGPIQNNNKVGICRRSGACRRERDRLRSGRVTGYKEKNELTFRMKMLNTARNDARYSVSRSTSGRTAKRTGRIPLRSIRSIRLLATCQGMCGSSACGRTRLRATRHLPSLSRC